MKRVFNTLVLFAATALAFSACIKPEIEAQPSEEDYYYTFVIGSPETRSILASDDQGKFGQWEDGDRLGTAVGNSNPGYSAVIINVDGPEEFSIYKQGGLAKDDVIYAYYPYNSSTSSITAVPFEIPENQSQNGETFDYDAMPMAAAGCVVPESMASSTNQTPVGEINFYNLGSVIDFQVFSSNETYAAETILNVKFSASGAISGSFTKDISSIQANDASSLTISGFTGTEVTTTVDNAPSMGSTRNDAAHIYMVIGPSSGITGSVIVTTNKAVYTYSMSTAQTFKRAGLKTFGLNLATCSDRVEMDTPIPVINSFKLDDYYQASDKVNPLHLNDIVTISTTTKGNSGKFYGTAPNRDWRLYQADGAFITVSVPVGYELQTIQFTYGVSNGGALNGAASGQLLTVSGNTQTYNVINTGTATNGQVRLTAITVKYAASTTFDFESISDLNDIVESDSKQFYGKLTNAIVSFVPGSDDAIIKDATGSILFHKSGHGLLQGQTYTGTLVVSAQLFNACSEITECDASFTGTETGVAPAEVTLTDLVGNLSTYQNAYVKVENLTVTNVTNNNNKGTVNVTDGTNNYVVFTSYGNAAYTNGDIITVEGTVAHYGDKDQIKVWSADDINKTGHTTLSYIISITVPSQPGCSISASVDGTPISSGASVESGKTVSLTATVGTGYNFNGWAVNGATVANASAATTTFTVEDSDVSISASFSTGGSDVEVLREDFSSITTGNNTSTNGSSSAWNGNGNFPTVSRAYQAGGAIKIGASGNPGSITSKNLNLSKSFTVSLDVKGWTTVEGDIKVTVGTVTKTITYTQTMSSSFGTYTLNFDAATTSSTVTIATTAKRAFIDNVVITRHD